MMVARATFSLQYCVARFCRTDKRFSSFTALGSVQDRGTDTIFPMTNYSGILINLVRILLGSNLALNFQEHELHIKAGQERISILIHENISFKGRYLEGRENGNEILGCISERNTLWMVE